MSLIIEYVRRLAKAITTIGQAATIPPNNDHTTGVWADSDIYERELMVNLPDEILYTRNGNKIVRLNLDIFPKLWLATVNDIRAITVRHNEGNCGCYANGIVYKYDSLSELTDDGIDILQPTNVTGDGRWLKVLKINTELDVPNNIAEINEIFKVGVDIPVVNKDSEVILTLDNKIVTWKHLFVYHSIADGTALFSFRLDQFEIIKDIDGKNTNQIRIFSIPFDLEIDEIITVRYAYGNAITPEPIPEEPPIILTFDSLNNSISNYVNAIITATITNTSPTKNFSTNLTFKGIGADIIKNVTLVPGVNTVTNTYTALVNGNYGCTVVEETGKLTPLTTTFVIAKPDYKITYVSGSNLLSGIVSAGFSVNASFINLSPLDTLRDYIRLDIYNSTGVLIRSMLSKNVLLAPNQSINLLYSVDGLTAGTTYTIKWVRESDVTVLYNTTLTTAYAQPSVIAAYKTAELSRREYNLPGIGDTMNPNSDYSFYEPKVNTQAQIYAFANDLRAQLQCLAWFNVQNVFTATGALIELVIDPFYMDTLKPELVVGMSDGANTAYSNSTEFFQLYPNAAASKSLVSGTFTAILTPAAVTLINSGSVVRFKFYYPDPNSRGSGKTLPYTLMRLSAPSKVLLKLMY
jgi:hypothetical protein